MSAQQKIPQTITTSYGDDEQTVPRDYATTVCAHFAQLGVRGSSLVFSSGDWGVGGAECQTNDGRNITRFQPMFPGSCKPFLICMQLVADLLLRPLCYHCWRNDWYQARDGHFPHRRRVLELLYSTFLSGQGGQCVHQEFERHLRRTLQVRSLSPRIWQTISEERVCLLYYSAHGRGFPDIAARSDKFRVIVGGKTFHAQGTSASAPVCHPQDKSVSCI